MSRALRADGVLRALMSGDPERLRADTGAGAFGRGLASLQGIWLGDEQATLDAAEALATAHDPTALTLARAVAGLAIAQFPSAIADPRLADPRTGGDVLVAARDDPQPVDQEFAPVLGILVVEAALACARIDLASALLADLDPPDTIFGCRDHPFVTFSRIVRARVLTFAGEIAAAGEVVDAAVADAGTPLELVLARAVAALVRGNADDRRETRAIVELVEDHGVAPVDMVTRGCFVLAAYGAVALGDLPRAVRLLLSAGGGPELDGLRVIDRALGLELLVAAAADAGDADAAAAWLSRALPLEEHPIAISTVARMRARVALLGENAETAIGFAEAARRRAEQDGRAIESAEADIILARARIMATGGGSAARDLADGAVLARASGHKAYLRSAAKELRTVGRRLPPDPARGWQGLSAREREVAVLLAEGLTNVEIAKALFLSSHTVRMHTSRILHAFGVPTRAGVAIALASPDPPGATPLTARQNEIVALVVGGAGNREIADSLGISVSTVEKHVAEIMRRWGVRSRAGIVRVAGVGERDAG
ncbi:MAG TPA: helix-turn-helix transcriptional regulator [Pseudolysinimonas sp.]|jgi:DNA-binding NarL/FixJ family response regulator|nr:helix-turn-helix transcriptional regulator [Pseudolysinimonas sp.]